MMNYFLDIIEITLPVSILILILALFSPLLKREFIAKWSYYMWLFIAVRISLPMKLVTEQTAIKITTSVPKTFSGIIVTEALAQINLQKIITLLYFVGVGIFLLIKLLSYGNFIIKAKRWQSGCDQIITDCIDNLCSELKIKKLIPAFTCKNISTPMLVGLFRPKLLLPNKSFTDSQLEFIITHELMHLKNRDIWYKAILMIANALHWFNPVVYLMVRMANRDVEIVCDNSVVRNKNIEYRQEYCRTILLIAHKGFNPPLSTGFAVSKKIIKKRFEDILSLKLKKRGLLLFAAVAISVVGTGYMISFAQETIKKEIEEEHEIVVRTTPTPTIIPTKEPEPLPTLTVTLTKQKTQSTNTVYTHEITPVPTMEPSEEPIEETLEETEQSTQVEWWDEVITYGTNRLGKPGNLCYVNKGEVKFFQADFEKKESNTANNIFYVEPNQSISVYHDGGVVQIADAKTGELVHDSSTSENSNVSTITTGATGAYYMVNISKTDDGKDKADVFILEN